jgi:hypothetical protein
MKLSLVTARVLRVSDNGKEKEKNENYLVIHKNTETPESVAMGKIEGLVDPENITSTKLQKGALILPNSEGRFFYYANGSTFVQKEDDEEDLEEVEFKYYIKSDKFDDAYKALKSYLDNGGDKGLVKGYDVKSLSKKNILGLLQ